MMKTVSHFFNVQNLFIVYKCLKNIFAYRVCSVNTLTDYIARGSLMKMYAFTYQTNTFILN